MSFAEHTDTHILSETTAHELVGTRARYTATIADQGSTGLSPTVGDSDSQTSQKDGLHKNDSSKIAKPTICFVSHLAYGALTGGHSGHIGGVEWQTSLMAKWFAARGYRVSMVTWDEGGQESIIDGVHLIRMCRRDAGLPGVRFFHPRWSSLIRALCKANADVYYHNCGEYVTGQVALWCQQQAKRFVYSVASDPDCDPRLPKMKSLREVSLYRYGLKRADRIIVQTQGQRRMLWGGFGIDSVVIPMPCPDRCRRDSVSSGIGRCHLRSVAWVGKTSYVKRLEWLLDIACGMPDVVFEVVGPWFKNDYANALQERASRIRNIRVVGRVSRDDMDEVYRRAALLCCTSRLEGFPNTFLEAWSHGLPVVSTVDPDNIIASRELGAVGGNVPELITSIRRLLNSPEQWSRASRNARGYYEDNHALEAVMPQFEHVFLSVVRDRA